MSRLITGMSALDLDASDEHAVVQTNPQAWTGTVRTPGCMLSYCHYQWPLHTALGKPEGSSSGPQ